MKRIYGSALLLFLAVIVRADLLPPFNGIANGSTLQSGAVLFVSSGTFGTQLNVPDGTANNNAASYNQVGLFQTVFSSETAGGTSTSATFANAGSSATIVAKATGTKNRIRVTGSWSHSSITAQSQIGIARNSTSLITTAAALQMNDPVIGKIEPYFVEWVDPTTNTAGASVSYQTQIATSGATLTTGGAAATGSATTMTIDEVK